MIHRHSTLFFYVDGINLVLVPFFVTADSAVSIRPSARCMLTDKEIQLSQVLVYWSKRSYRSYRSAQELKADTLPAHALGDSHLYTLSPKL